MFNFYDTLFLSRLQRSLYFPVVKCILVASAGFLKDQFYDWMMAEALKSDEKILLDNKSKFLLAHSSSGHKHALKGLYKIIEMKIVCFVIAKFWFKVYDLPHY